MCLVLVCLSFLTQSHMLQVQPSLPNSEIIHWRICIWNTDKVYRGDAEPEIDRTLQCGYPMMGTVWMVDRHSWALLTQLWALLGNRHTQVWTLSCILPCETHTASAVGCTKAAVFPCGACKYFQLSFTSWCDGIISLTLGHNVCLENHVWVSH